MKSTKSFKSKFFPALALATITAPAMVLADVSFTEIALDHDDWGGAVAVSNNGVVAFTSDTTLYKWSKNNGLVALGEVEWSRVARPHISNEGDVIAFNNLSYSDSGDTHIYTDTTLRIIDRLEFNSSVLSSNGAILGGRTVINGVAYAANLNLVNDTVTTFPDTAEVQFVKVSSLSHSGDVVSLTTKSDPGDWVSRNGSYVVSSNGEPQLIEGISFLYSVQVLGNGQKVIAEVSSCTNIQPAGTAMCAASWNKSANELTEIGYFRPTDASSDGSIVVGNGWSDFPGAKIWDAYNGTRNVEDVLSSKGINMDGWSEFKGLNISDDGNKIAGYATNPAGQTRPFLIDIIPQCTGL